MKVINEEFKWENFGVAQVKQAYKNIETLINEYVDTIKSIEDKNLNFKNVFKSGDLLSADLSKEYGILHIFEMVHGKKEIRDISRSEVIRIGELLNKFSYNEDVFNKANTYYKTIYKKEKTKLTEEERKIVEDTMRGYKKMGMHLPKDKRDLLIKLNNKADKIASDFNLACTKNYEKGVWFSLKDLEGVPENIITSFKFDDKKKKYFVSAFLRSQYREVQKYAIRKNTREKITKVHENGVGPVNTKRLGEILKIRQEITKVLGFKTYSDLVMTEQMVNKPAQAKKFLEQLAKNLSRKLKKEKEEAKGVLGIYKEKLNTSNTTFAENILQKDKVNLNLQDYQVFKNQFQDIISDSLELGAIRADELFSAIGWRK